MAGPPEVDAVVIGGGIAGLAAAIELQRHFAEVLVLDASDRPGGVMRTDHVGRYVVERGPATIQVKAPMLAVLRERELDGGLRRAQPESRERFLWRDDRLMPVPLGPLGLLTTPLLSARGKLRLLAEPFAGRARSGESVAEWSRRRLGPEAAAQLVGPFLTGIYAGDEERLGAEAVFGGLVALERRFGSVALGGLATALGRRRRRGLAGIWSGLEGLGPLARRLAECLDEPPAVGVRVTRMLPEQGSWRLELRSGAGDTAVRAARVVLAVPAHDAAALVRPIDGLAAELLAAIDYAPIVALPLGVRIEALQRPPRGFGFLVPRGEEAGLLGCLFMSRLFPGRAPPGHELLHCMLGGTRWRSAVHEPGDRLRRRTFDVLDRVFGLGDEPEDLGATRWSRAVPQPGRDHPRRLAQLRSRLAAHPGLVLAGGYVAGVSVADSFASGQQAARELVAAA